MASEIDVTDLKGSDPETLQTARSVLEDTRDESHELVKDAEEMLTEMEDRRRRMERLQARAGPVEYDEVVELLEEHEDDIASTESLKAKAEKKRDFAERRIAEIDAVLDS